ncbi:hypothetical protein [Paraburkholderia elongata]|uniref:Uncharacterized protein n=1 Tax=Paraburkholderia elongata TaxID=2675747 RepID=A0A972SLJ4_9BURK|nr:hypothetical protein [Paraburkholderia elongata]NPT57865.1 hypothetical protein [Paraburkholderia elongata]
MGQSDTDTGSYMATTSSLRAGARATGSKNRALENIDASAPGIYPGGQYSTTDNASAIYAPVWKADPYPVY